MSWVAKNIGQVKISLVQELENSQNVLKRVLSSKIQWAWLIYIRWSNNISFGLKKTVVLAVMMDCFKMGEKNLQAVLSFKIENSSRPASSKTANSTLTTSILSRSKHNWEVASFWEIGILASPPLSPTKGFAQRLPPLPQPGGGGQPSPRWGCPWLPPRGRPQHGLHQEQCSKQRSPLPPPWPGTLSQPDRGTFRGGETPAGAFADPDGWNLLWQEHKCWEGS